MTGNGAFDVITPYAENTEHSSVSECLFYIRKVDYRALQSRLRFLPLEASLRNNSLLLEEKKTARIYACAAKNTQFLQPHIVSSQKVGIHMIRRRCCMFHVVDANDRLYSCTVGEVRIKTISKCISAFEIMASNWSSLDY